MKSVSQEKERGLGHYLTNKYYVIAIALFVPFFGEAPSLS